jgi:hypothetical protein
MRSSIDLPGVTAELLFNLQSSGGATFDVRRKLTTEANRWNFNLNSCDYYWSLPRVKREKKQDMEKIVTLKPQTRDLQHKHSDAKLKIIRKNSSCKGISPRKKTKESCSPREIV